MRLAQEDIYDFCVNPEYTQTLTWPDDYWPKAVPPSEAAWDRSVASFRHTREKMKALVRDVPDLTSRVPTGKAAQTFLRAILLVADHTAYHVGQLVALRRALGTWNS
jgi:uncharacterized damage-inducible protein DinB